jgi:hypothetical protein
MNTSDKKRMARLPLSRGASALLATAMLLLALAPMARAAVVSQTFVSQVYALPTTFAATPLSSASNVQAQQFVQWLRTHVTDSAQTRTWTQTEVAALLREWQVSQRGAVSSPQLCSSQLQTRQQAQSSTRLNSLSDVAVTTPRRSFPPRVST